jgi:hypothetical protein
LFVHAASYLFVFPILLIFVSLFQDKFHGSMESFHFRLRRTKSIKPARKKNGRIPPQRTPVIKRSQCVLLQTPAIFAAVSTKIGKEIKMNVLAFGMVGAENPLMKGKIKVPRRKPAYIPKQRAQTAVGYPKTQKHREGIWWQVGENTAYKNPEKGEEWLLR